MNILIKMRNTRIFFLCSFKKNEYKTFEIYCMFRKEKKNKIEHDSIIPDLIELGNDGEYLIKIGIVDFTKNKIQNNNYLAFNVKVKANKKDYWTENKMFNQYCQNFLFDCLLKKSNNNNPPNSLELSIQSQYSYFGKYIEQQDNIINLYNELNRDIINYLPYLTVENYDIIFMILRKIFFCNDRQSLANLFCCLIDFSFIKNLPEKKSNEL